MFKFIVVTYSYFSSMQMEPMNHNEGVCPTKMPLRKKKKFVLGHKVTKVAQQVIKASFKATHPITSQQDVHHTMQYNIPSHGR